MIDQPLPNSQPPQRQNNERTKRQNRRAVSGLVVLFALPVLMAYIAFQLDWFNMATRNKGNLLPSPYPRFEQFSWQDSDSNPLHFKDFETQWWWIYFPNSNECNAHCELNMEFLTRTHLGLAKRAEKLTRLVVFPSQILYQDRASKTHELVLAKGEGSPHVGESITLKQGKIYAMDPHGNIFMEYDAITSLEEAKIKSKDFRDDITRVMKNTGL